MICFPNAKINLGLHVINRRDDGFHNIETVFYPLMFCDILEMVKSKRSKGGNEKVEFSSEGLRIEGEAKDNLIIRAFDLVDSDFKREGKSDVLSAVKCFLYKKIPMGAGLGGGSANAAFAIKLVDQVFDLKLSKEQMNNYASRLGSDCTFFVENKPAYALGRGNELESFSIDLSAYFIALLFPGVHSNTSLAYQNVLKRGSFDERTSFKNLLQKPVREWKYCIENDFEKSVFKAIPQLPAIKQQLYDCGALYASMSGSGSAMFGIFEQEPRLSDELKKWVCYSGKM